MKVTEAAVVLDLVKVLDGEMTLPRDVHQVTSRFLELADDARSSFIANPTQDYYDRVVDTRRVVESLELVASRWS